MTANLWVLVALIVGSTIALAYLIWRQWVRPWRLIEQLVRQIVAGERPRTFLIGAAAAEPRRVAVALEDLFVRQQQLAQQIVQRESGTQTILAAMEDGLLVVDARRRITLANDAFRRLIGVSEISMGDPLLDVIREPTVDRVIEQTLRTNQSEQSEIVLGDPPRRIQVSAVPMKDQLDHTTGVVVLFHDITELKRADQSRSDFVANVSHELRTPLSILRGYIETLLEDPQTSRDELRRILQVMERHSKRLGLLVDDLLTLAQLESPSPNLQLSDVKIDNLLASVVRDWEKKFAEKQLNVVVDLAPGLPTIRADETRLQEILYNLLDNAVKYSRAGDEIRLQAEVRDGAIALNISDSGTGISRDDLPRIFERFYRADRARSRELGGTGLGLSIVKHITQLHGGRVEAESEVGRGTTIRVFLPNESKDGGAAVTES
jgi:two-component system phosphate regulon sensor histidine kinase PhoR